MQRQYAIRLKAMQFHAHVGVLPHEAEFAQPIEIDLCVWVTRSESTSGADGIVDYRHLYDLVGGVVAKGHVRYLEELVDTIADGALAMDAVSRVEVRARKPQVALPGPLMHAEVSLDRLRG